MHHAEDGVVHEERGDGSGRLRGFVGGDGVCDVHSDDGFLLAEKSRGRDRNGTGARQEGCEGSVIDEV